MIQYVGRTRALSGTLPSGDRGTEATLAVMKNLVEGPNGARHPIVREAAISILARDGNVDHNPLGQLRALYYFVRDCIAFVGDVAGVETLQSPRYTLQVRAGDCDDRATLIAALARAIGIPAALRFRVIAANPGAQRTYSHVYVMARVAGRDFALDPTYRSNPFNFQYPLATRVGDFPV